MVTQVAHKRQMAAEKYRRKNEEEEEAWNKIKPTNQ